MSEADARVVAARAVGAVIGRGRSLDEALPAVASPKARALAFETLRSGLRYRFYLERLMERPLPRKEAQVEGLLLVALCELERFRTPEYATVDATVAATRKLGRPRLAKLVNGVLRNYLRRREELARAAADDPAAAAAHPAWLVEHLNADWPDDADAVLAAGNDKGPMWLRVNTARISPGDYRGRLAEAGIEAGPRPVPEALRLSAPVEVDDLPGFRDGLVSVQDAAAQLAAGLLAPEDGNRVLDLACAPGGKLAHLLERYPGIGDAVGVDESEQRLGRAADNLKRLGLADRARLVPGDGARPAEWWDGRPFDRILLDAPCSGTGVIRRHPDIKWLRRSRDIAAHAKLQAALIEAAWSMLAPGGRLLYATCSVLRSENEGVVEAFLASTPSARAATLHAEWGRKAGPGRQILPGESGMDGFFYALLARD
jgi:16S rRNA (cytosine967-C5)-methyltransferase